jgi:DNA helicase II / ATP-dependent DNA helicase PcrA
MVITQDFKLNIYQQTLIEYMNNKDEKHAICNAVAGSGKSTTLYQVALSLQERGIEPKNIIVVVFGKQNSLDLQTKFGEEWRSSICTLHSLGYSLCSDILTKKLTLEPKKYWNIAKYSEYFTFHFKKGILLESGAIDDESQFLNLFNLARYALGCFEADELKEIATHYNLHAIYDFDICSEACKTLDCEGKKLAEVNGIIDYSDMIYLPIVYKFWNYGWFNHYQYALIDECQDLNPCQVEMTARLSKRLLYVGDPHQSIYGFAGAGINSYYDIKDYLEPVELPLSVCYRCPASHIEFVNQLFPSIAIKPATNAKKGLLVTISEGEASHKDNDLILSRRTAPLVKYCLKLIGQGISAKVKGKDIASTLITEIDNIYNHALATLSHFLGEVPKFDHFLGYLQNYQQLKQHQWYELDNYDRLCELLDDKLNVLQVVYNNLKDDERAFSFEGLKETIGKLFTNEKQAITLCTVHRAKGLESERVYILEPNDMPLSWRHQKDWEYEQEKNLLYVALTRSKSELYLIGNATWFEVIGALDNE